MYDVVHSVSRAQETGVLLSAADVSTANNGSMEPSKVGAGILLVKGKEELSGCLLWRRAFRVASILLPRSVAAGELGHLGTLNALMMDRFNYQLKRCPRRRAECPATSPKQ